MQQSDDFRTYLDQAEVIILVLNNDGRVHFINRRGAELLGLPVGEIVGLNWFERFIPEASRGELRTVFQSTLHDHGSSTSNEFFENPVRTAGGSEILVAWKNTLLRDASDEVIGTLSTGEEVTVRRRMENALRESEATLRAILETCVDGIITIDEAGRVLSFNPAAVRIFGFQPDEIVGQDVSILMPSPHAGAHLSYIDRFLQTHETRIIGRGREVLGRRKDGTEFPLYLAVSDVTIRGGKMFTGIVRDLTEFKRMQEEIVQSQKLAAIGEMAASVGHEIKNPLAGISGAIEILKDTFDNDDPRLHVMEDILFEVRRLDNTVRDLLAFSRPWNPDLQDCSLQEIAERVARAFQEQEDLTRVRFRFGKPIDGLARVDPWLFEKVLWNLLDNANDAMGGEGEIRFGFAEGPGFVEISVTDSGDGIPPDLLKDVFRPFFTTKNRGTGLGLAICKKILDAHGGSIYLTSTVRKGTTARIRLPAAAPEPRNRTALS